MAHRPWRSAFALVVAVGCSSSPLPSAGDGDASTVDASRAETGGDVGDAPAEHPGGAVSCGTPSTVGPAPDGGVAPSLTSLAPEVCDKGWCRRQTSASLSALWAASASDVWVVEQVGGVLHWNGADWTRTQLQPAATADGLFGIWGSGSKDVWVVGSKVVHHWDGSTWSQDAGAMAGDLSLMMVQGTGPTDVWAFGPDATGRAHTLHWDGHAWSKSAALTFYPVSAWGSAPSDWWLVDGDGALQHGDGNTWSPVALDVPDPKLSAVWGSGPNDAWAVGDQFVWRFDGMKWTKTSSPYALKTVWGSGPNDVWIGDDRHVLRWNGDAWSMVYSRDDLHLWVGAAWGSADDDVWAADKLGQGIAHYDGKDWSVFPVPGGGEISAGWSFSRDDAWASGEHGLLRWNGTAWVAAPSIPGKRATPAPGGGSVWAEGNDIPTPGEQTTGIWGSGPDDVWAVGNAVHHWDGKTWTDRTASVCPGVAPESSGFNKVWGSAADDVWLGFDGAKGPAAAHWDGTSWSSSVLLPEAPRSLWSSGRDDVWSLGIDSLSRFDGVGWSDFPKRIGHTRTVWGSRKDSVWIFGADASPLGWIEHWDGSSWSSQGAMTLWAAASLGPDQPLVIGRYNFGDSVLLRRAPP
jgi:hypothetical protein